MKTVIYSKYSNERNHRLAIRTDILEDENGRRYVRKMSEFPEGQMHVAALYHWYQSFSELCRGTRLSYNRCEIVPGGVELEYLTGETLEEHLLKVLKDQGISQCVSELFEYLELVRDLHSGETFENTLEFQQVFGNVEPKTGCACGPCSNIDLVCGNILITGDTWTAIDYEWSFDFPIPVNYLLYRIIFYFTDHAGRGAEFRNYDLMGQMGITKEEQELYARMETHFQHYVCRNHTPLRDLYGEISEGVFQVEESIGREALQVFFDYGQGCCEQQSVTIPMDHWGIRKEVTLPKDLKGLRVDPGSAAGMVKIRELKFDTDERRAAFTLREGAVVGDWLYLGDSDPNILINRIPKGAKTLTVDLTVYPVEEIPMEEMARLAKEYVKQKQLLREMQNTKVWKMYRKYRDKKDKQ